MIVPWRGCLHTDMPYNSAAGFFRGPVANRVAGTDFLRNSAAHRLGFRWTGWKEGLASAHSSEFSQDSGIPIRIVGVEQADRVYRRRTPLHHVYHFTTVMRARVVAAVAD